MTKSKLPHTAWKKGEASPNPNGRPKKAFRDFTPAELKQFINKLKKVVPECAEVLIELMRKEESQAAKAKVAKEIVSLYFSALSQQDRIMNSMHNLTKDKKDKESIYDEDEEEPNNVVQVNWTVVDNTKNKEN